MKTRRIDTGRKANARNNEYKKKAREKRSSNITTLPSTESYVAFNTGMSEFVQSTTVAAHPRRSPAPARRSHVHARYSTPAERLTLPSSAARAGTLPRRLPALHHCQAQRPRPRRKRSHTGDLVQARRSRVFAPEKAMQVVFLFARRCWLAGTHHCCQE